MDVGFIWHYPFVDVGTPEVARTGVTAMIARVPWASAQPTPETMDFTALERQIRAAEAGGYRLVLLLECNPFCAPAWLRSRVANAGETVRDPAGVIGDIPSITSRTFEQAQTRFIRSVLGFVRKRDHTRRVQAYQVGVEWWFPDSFRYAPADVERFQRWVVQKHGSIGAVNRLWGTAYGTLHDIKPPRLTMTGELWRSGRSGLAPIHDLDALPQGRDAPPATHEWQRFWQETAAQYVDDLAAMACKADSTRPVMTFLTHAYALAAEWDYVDWSAMRVDLVAHRGRHISNLGLQLPVARGDAYRIAVGLDTARKYRKPVTCLDVLDFTDGVAAGRDVMERATHTAVQHGAAGVFYCCWHGAKDFNFYPDWRVDELRQLVWTARTAGRPLCGMRVVPDGALVLPYMPGTPRAEGRPSCSVHSFMGWYRLLQTLHVCVDVVTLYDLERGFSLRPYPWVILPRCCSAPRRALSEIAAYSRYGRLVVAGEDPAYDEYGRPLSVSWNSAQYVHDYGLDYAGIPVRVAKAGDTPPLEIWREPARSEKVRENALWDLRHTIMAHRARNAIAVQALSYTVSVVRWRKPRSEALYMVRTQPGREGCATVRLDRRYEVAGIWADGVSAQAERSDRDGGTIRTPPFRSACLVVVRVSARGRRP